MYPLAKSTFKLDLSVFQMATGGNELRAFFHCSAIRALFDPSFLSQNLNKFPSVKPPLNLDQIPGYQGFPSIQQKQFARKFCYNWDKTVSISLICQAKLYPEFAGYGVKELASFHVNFCQLICKRPSYLINPFSFRALLFQALFTLLRFRFYPFSLMKTLSVHITPFSN